jgi:hypothetical protein
MKLKIMVWIWHLLNLLLCVLLGGAWVTYQYSTLVSYEMVHSDDFYYFIALMAVPGLGGLYHFYRLFRPSNLEGTETWGQVSFAVSFQALVLLAMPPVFLFTGMIFGERIDTYHFRMGPYYMRVILGAETAYHDAKGVYTDIFSDLTDASPPFLDGKWDVPKSGYDIAITISDGGKHFVATAIPGKNRKHYRQGYYVDDYGKFRCSAEGTIPTKESRLMYEDYP